MFGSSRIQDWFLGCWERHDFGWVFWVERRLLRWWLDTGTALSCAIASAIDGINRNLNLKVWHWEMRFKCGNWKHMVWGYLVLGEAINGHYWDNV